MSASGRVRHRISVTRSCFISCDVGVRNSTPAGAPATPRGVPPAGVLLAAWPTNSAVPQPVHRTASSSFAFPQYAHSFIGCRGLRFGRQKTNRDWREKEMRKSSHETAQAHFGISTGPRAVPRWQRIGMTALDLRLMQAIKPGETVGSESEHRGVPRVDYPVRYRCPNSGGRE